ncbi:MAG: hypothetical protein ABI425_05350 [Patescibacteria group bacterium]
MKLESNFLLKFDIYWLRKYHYLCADKQGAMEWYNSLDDETQTFSISSHVEDYHPYLYLLYDLSDGQKYPLKIYLTRTPCTYGGWRYWFLCPVPKNGLICGKRVGVLYKVRNFFGCRHCFELTYTCRKRNDRHSMYSWFHATALMHRYERHLHEVKRVKHNHKFTKKYLRMEKSLVQFKEFLDKAS